MNNYSALWAMLAIALTTFSSCKKCQTCDVREIGAINALASDIEICGTDDDLESKQRDIKDNYGCIECVVNTSFGPTTTGYLCGDRTFTDSIEAAVRTGAITAGFNYNCNLYRDTLQITCILKND